MANSIDVVQLAQYGLALLLVFGSFTVSASAGLGGSLLLVPTLSLLLGTKEGVALAALLLGTNNIIKVLAYRRTLPFRASALVVVLTMVGAAVGSTLLIHAPTSVVTAAVIATFAASLLAERRGVGNLRSYSSAPLALLSGASSGFSGTSGPLKGVAVRNLGLDRRHTVGAASLASLFGDLTKAALYTEAGLLGRSSLMIAGAAVPLMLAGTWLGSRLNNQASERRFAMLFWTVMGGYTVRLLVLAA